MPDDQTSQNRRRSFKQWVQAVVRRRFWRMDIAPDCRIAETALIDRTWPRGIHFADGVSIGEEAVILTHDMTRGLYLDTRVGPGTRVGPRAILMPGVTVGAHCDIRPGALVNRDVPDHSIVEGNPGKVIGTTTPGAA